MESRDGPEMDPWPTAFVATAGLTMLLLLAADLYVELIAAGAAYAATGVIVHFGTHSAHPETT